MTGNLVWLAAVALALLSVWSFLFTYSVDRLAGVCTSLLIVMVTSVPMQLVPSPTRTAELVALVALTVPVLLRRNVSLQGGIPALVASYLLLTHFSTMDSTVDGAGVRLLLHVVVGLGFVLLGATLNRAEWGSVRRTIVALALAQSTYAVYEFAARPPTLWASAAPDAAGETYGRLPHEIISGAFRAQGTFGHPLLLAMFLMVALAILVRNPPQARFTQATMVGLLFTGLVCTGSRSLLIISLAIVLFAFGAARYSVARGVMLTTTFAALAFLLPFGSDTYQRFRESGSLSHRLGALESVPRLLEQHQGEVLFGHGWASTVTLTERGLLQTDGFVAIDNQWVALLAMSGLLGVLFWVVIAATSLRQASGPLRLPLVAIYLCFITFDVLIFPATWALLALLLGLVASSNRRGDELGPHDSDSRLERQQGQGGGQRGCDGRGLTQTHDIRRDPDVRVRVRA